MGAKIGPRYYPDHCVKIMHNGWEIQWDPPVTERRDFEQYIMRGAAMTRRAHPFGYEQHIHYELRSNGKWLLIYDPTPEGVQQFRFQVDEMVQQFLLKAPRRTGVKKGFQSEAKETWERALPDLPEYDCKLMGGRWMKLSLKGTRVVWGSKHAEPSATSPPPVSHCYVQSSGSKGFKRAKDEKGPNS